MCARRRGMHPHNPPRLVRPDVFLIAVDRLVALLDPATLMICIRVRLQLCAR